LAWPFEPFAIGTLSVSAKVKMVGRLWMDASGPAL
jgi:hypothetical protein